MESRTDEPRPPETSGARAEVPVDASPVVRCILALPESSPAPPVDLVEAFAARNLEVRECAGPFEAMGALMSLARDARQPIALVVVEPSLFPANRAAELMRSAAKYTGRAARWVYERRRSPRLQKWSEPEDGSAKVNGIQEAIRRVQGSPPLRLTGFADADRPQADGPATDRDDAESAHSAGILTEEELAMLLGRDDPDLHGGTHESPDADEPDDGPPTYDRTSS